MSVALSFISILGIETEKYDVAKINSVIRERQLMRIFNTFFSKNFTAVDKLANIPSFIDKIKPIFDKIVQNYIDLFTPALISFSKNNSELGEWILKKLMKRDHSSTYAKLVGEIILSDPTQYRARILLLLEFILNEFKLFSKQNKETNLFGFMGIFSACIYKAPLLEDGDFTLPADEDTFKTFLRAL